MWAWLCKKSKVWLSLSLQDFKRGVRASWPEGGARLRRARPAWPDGTGAALEGALPVLHAPQAPSPALVRAAQPPQAATQVWRRPARQSQLNGNRHIVVGVFFKLKKEEKRKKNGTLWICEIYKDFFFVLKDTQQPALNLDTLQVSG